MNLASAFAGAAFLLTIITTPICADIYRWDNGEVIPGTEGIEPGVRVECHQPECALALSFLFFR